MFRFISLLYIFWANHTHPQEFFIIIQLLFLSVEDTFASTGQSSDTSWVPMISASSAGGTAKKSDFVCVYIYIGFAAMFGHLNLNIILQNP